MQAIFEPIFHIVYLTTVIILGFILVRGSQSVSNTLYFKLFGYMALLLGFGDAFHLVPRTYAFLTTGLEDYTTALGFGKLITSITMTFFYYMLYFIWKIRFNKTQVKKLDYVMLLLLSSRILLCLFPQNAWFSDNPPISWGIYRNIPFLIMGIIMIGLLYVDGRRQNDRDYLFMSIAVFLSYALYIPVVLFAQDYPLIGMLMVPKTIAYVWIVWIGYKEYKEQVAYRKC